MVLACNLILLQSRKTIPAFIPQLTRLSWGFFAVCVYSYQTQLNGSSKYIFGISYKETLNGSYKSLLTPLLQKITVLNEGVQINISVACETKSGPSEIGYLTCAFKFQTGLNVSLSNLHMNAADDSRYEDGALSIRCSNSKEMDYFCSFDVLLTESLAFSKDSLIIGFFQITHRFVLMEQCRVLNPNRFVSTCYRHVDGIE